MERECHKCGNSGIYYETVHDLFGEDEVLFFCDCLLGREMDRRQLMEQAAFCEDVEAPMPLFEGPSCR